MQEPEHYKVQHFATTVYRLELTSPPPAGTKLAGPLRYPRAGWLHSFRSHSNSNMLIHDADPPGSEQVRAADRQDAGGRRGAEGLGLRNIDRVFRPLEEQQLTAVRQHLRREQAGGVLEPGDCTAFRSHSNGKTLTHPARGAGPDGDPDAAELLRGAGESLGRVVALLP